MKKLALLTVAIAACFSQLQAGFGFFFNFCPPPVVEVRPAPVVVVAAPPAPVYWQGYYVRYRPCRAAPVCHERVELRTPCQELVQERSQDQLVLQTSAPRRALR